MREEELLRLIEKGESETLEFKPSLSQINEIVESVSGFSNKKYGKITRAEYEKLYFVSDRTANRELTELFRKKIIEKKGKGPETYYVLARYGEIWRDKKGEKNE